MGIITAINLNRHSRITKEEIAGETINKPNNEHKTLY